MFKHRDQITAAINALLADAGIDLRVGHPDPARYKVAVPGNMNSLFDSLKIDVERLLLTNGATNSVSVRWAYGHPAGACGGHPIGVVYSPLLDAQGQQTQWRRHGTERKGFIDPYTLTSHPVPLA